MRHNRSVTYGTAIYNIGCVVTPKTKLKRYGLVTKLLSSVLEPTLLCGAGARWKFANYVSALPAGSLLDPTNRGHWRGLEGGSGEKGRRKTARLFPDASCLSPQLSCHGPWRFISPVPTVYPSPSPLFSELSAQPSWGPLPEVWVPGLQPVPQASRF